MPDAAEKRLRPYYPPVALDDGSEAPVVAWIWTRTVRSPDPHARGAHVPLTSSFLLSSSPGRKVWVEPVIESSERSDYRFQVQRGNLTKEIEERAKRGTKTGRGSNFSCVLTGATISSDYIRTEARAGRMSVRLMAIVVQGARGRAYVSPTRDHDAVARATPRPEVVELDVEMPTNRTSPIGALLRI
jgi:putative DNA methylase